MINDFSHCVLYFPKDKTFDAFPISKVSSFLKLFQKLQANDMKMRCTAEYDLALEEAVIVQSCRQKEVAEKLAQHCAHLKAKKFSDEKMLLRFNRLQPTERQKLRPLRCITTDFYESSEEEISDQNPETSHFISESSPVVRFHYYSNSSILNWLQNDYF